MRRWCVVAAILAAGCGAHPTHVHEVHEDPEVHPHEESVHFTEGQGMRLPKEMVRQLDVRLAEVSRREFGQTLVLNARVYRSDGQSAQAVAVIASNKTKMLNVGLEGSVENSGGERIAVARITSVQSKEFAEVEVVMHLSGNPAVGDHVRIKFESGSKLALAIPSSALLETIEGTFAFVAEGEHLIRTRIKTGERDGEWMEVLEGLQAGQRVVTNPVKKLWLTELHAQRGGEGNRHSH